MTFRLRYLGQAAAYAGFIIFIGWFSNAPSYTHTSPDQATIKLSLNHAGKLKHKCRKRTEVELADLAANMRTPFDCPRERSPIKLELAVDGVVLYRDSLAPTGLQRDGETTAYQRFNVKAGKHRLHIRMNDDIHSKDFTYVLDKRVNLSKSQVLVIKFDKLAGKFLVI